MGLGLLASRTLRSTSSKLLTTYPKSTILRTIVSTPDLHKPDAAAEPAAPEPDLPKRTPIAGARVHFPNPDDVIEVFVDGYPVKIPKGMTVLQACSVAGVDIPRFCYHDRLSIAGNCRMCLVEVEKSPKPVASCAMPALPGMKIKTDTPIAKKAREGVMEFLLMNHPLDCPICDQGGECDLQDQSMAFGSDRGRFTETKRSVVDKNLGPLVKTVMTRCIQCTRCVRFATEIAGVQDLGMLGRGSGEEIGTYVEKLMTSELSGNVIDICPVGALTSKPFAFKARNWELKGTETIDVTDAVGSNIRIDSRGPEVMRIVPRLNEDINEEWISDKTRFCYDGLKRQRLNDPMIRDNDGRFKPVSWHDALAVVAEVIHQVKPEEIVGVAGKLSDAESMMLLKDFLNKMGSNNVWCEGNGKNVNADLRSGYLLNSGISGLEKADCFLLVGTQPRVEAAMVNARIRKTVRATQAKVGYIGPPADFNYDHQHLGTGPETLVEIAEGRHSFSSALSAAKNPAIIIGAGIFEREDKDAIFSVVQSISAKNENLIRPDWNGVNVLLLNAAQAAALDLGLVPESDNSIESAKFVYLMGADDVDLDKVPKDAFVVYQGHHGDKGVYRANVILPGAAFSEKEGTYANTEGTAQQTVPAVPTVGDAREDWKIIRALSEVCGVKLPYDTISGVRSRIRTVAPNLLRVDEREPATFSGSVKPESSSKVSATPFGVTIDNFYMTDVITRASKIMAQCSALLKK
ncbi:NADH dehydrogenase [ubiquinone] iron-sulfur protein 1 [Helianthus annuus]|uniref:NADH dehydrogenase [ubiquinone] iron-sulfur protein 1, mitochondrial n=1 Tax=Helianthus annuus TaxID=4232 RepID=A0A251UAE5_HELAN|nr:NADH dehydrogenase [ubiquinone] iron-sulfur protein 1, mitochondrial [Helianthus annuus]KAF5798279.1 putative NADH:ubiquinone oxidoreductase, subunit G, NADH-quinone oxidoreductase, chain G [Helianthus annuus]KAJ0549901.1 NADH dehydrogenase [ubiquinone] iron-sulfur protein 1 [Helianthus annuus]KAJ0556450.1 NADH dehydrogenase [ubiquinone] iron-sulfur protein 1 [Helianthus annuus]KAJ0562860.1 NADH dehydrogenase [ubiquinone] iron-sulfur protein 1 [Helianthus annuus]KAJ0904402.1 NADH dehydrogen